MIIERTDREELVELMSRYADMPDTGNWDELPRSVFCDEFTADFSWLGAPVTTVSRDAWCQLSKQAFAGWTADPPCDHQPSDRHRWGSCDHLGPRPCRALGSPRSRGRRTELLAGRRVLRQRRRANFRWLAAELGQGDHDPPREPGTARGLDGGREGLTSSPSSASRSNDRNVQPHQTREKSEDTRKKTTTRSTRRSSGLRSRVQPLDGVRLVDSG